MKKKVIAILMAACMVVGMTACGSSANKTTAGKSSVASSETSTAGKDKKAGDKITVGFSQVGAESDWRTANSASMKETFSEKNGYDLIFDDAQQKQENQIAAIRNFIQQEVDYIVLAPVTETGWDTVLQEAKDAKIPVIIVDRMIKVSDDSLYTAWVGSNFEQEGDKATAWLTAYLKAAGKENDNINIVDIQGTIGSSAQIGRTAGLEKAVKANSKWKILAKETGEFTQAKGQEVMESMLKQYGKDINVVYCENDNEAFGAIDAIEAAGYKVGPDGDMLVMSFDSTNAGLTDVMNGKIICDTECNPLHGPRVQEIIKKLEAGGKPDKQEYVDEGIFAGAGKVSSVSASGKNFDVTAVTKDVISSRKY